MHIGRSIGLGAMVMIAAAAPAFAESATLFRVFLNDGTAVVSYGEYARVGDRIIFSMPIGAVAAVSEAPRLQAVNLPLSSINWTATERYAQAARYTQYVATTAESDYATLAGDVAATLNAIVNASNPRSRLELALSARRRLASWPKEHHGYRAADVREMLGLLDEAITGLRAAAGESTFVFDLVANAPSDAQRQSVPLLPAPSRAEALAHAVAVAKATDVSADRVTILRGVVASLDETGSAVPADWAVSTRRWALHAIREEQRADRAYASLIARLSKRAASATQRADVKAVASVLESVTKHDALLGRKRPEQINALIEQVRAQLDSARRLRLARDQWSERAAGYRAYKKHAAPAVTTLMKARQTLEEIRTLAGSEASALVALAAQLETNARAMSTMAVPDDLKPSHALLTSAVTLAQTAVKARRQATIAGELNLAWDASSAAAGSMMLFEKAREDMEAATRLPEIR